MRIGFLAMSGIRAHDPKLLEMGLTLPGFVERSKTVASLPSLGLLYLAACTPDGHELRYFEAESDQSVPPALFDCDLVAIGTFSAQVFEAYAVADALRARGVKVAMGGLHVSVRPDEGAIHADYVIVGEGDNVWPEVVRAADAQAPARRFDAADYGLVDVSRLPIPRYDLLDSRPYNRFTVQTSRGCPWRCEFCASNVMLGLRYRKRPIEQVIRDIQAIREVRENPFIEFADDNTFVDKEWGKELCRRLIPMRLKWFTETDVSVAQDAELLSLMHDAGCRQVLVGLESPSRGPLDGLEMRANIKSRWHAEYLDAVRTIQDHGITVNGCFILGLDGHGPDIFPRVLQFANEASLYDVQITVLTAFPGTPLYDRLKREGRIIEDRRWDLCTLFDVNHYPGGMSPQELREGMYWLTERLYDASGTSRRRTPFFDRARRRRFMQGQASRALPL
ncbi:MAG: B12-binding domain-containing radical SAM protein, partial [Tepidisphaeraceae bacterium]